MSTTPKTREQFDYVYYGTEVDTAELEGFVRRSLAENEALEARGRRKTPLCIWGRHGIGKTEIVEQVAREEGFQVVAIAPAQSEEMGDLAGMPTLVDSGDGKATRIAAPEWVPREPGPGVLLVDDVNRADDRILRGLMQLFQNHALVAWKLPPRWQIVATANPDGGDYSVTPMDDAMLTRMLHVTLRFDAKRWAAWAETHEVDPRGIAFVLAYPEVITGARTTPRTLVQFFERTRDIADLQKEIDLVAMLGESCLDKATVMSFISFVNGGLSALVSPEEILGAKSWEPVEKKLATLAMATGKKGKEILEGKRIDLLAAIVTRLVNHITTRKADLSDAEQKNLVALLRARVFPEDMRLALAADLGTIRKKSMTRVLGDPDVTELLLRMPPGGDGIAH